MYDRLSVFLSLLVFASAVPIHLFEIETVPVLFGNEIAVERVLSNRDHLPTPPPMPKHKSNGIRKQVLAVLRRGTRSIEIVPYSRQISGDGYYDYDSETADGIKVSEVGSKTEDIGTVSRGSYSYTSPDGVVITVNWTADENGFQATGDHLPTPPPMPEHRVKMLDDLKTARTFFKSVSESRFQEQIGEVSGNKVTGSYSYTAPDGSIISLTYVA